MRSLRAAVGLVLGRAVFLLQAGPKFLFQRGKRRQKLGAVQADAPDHRIFVRKVFEVALAVQHKDPRYDLSSRAHDATESISSSDCHSIRPGRVAQWCRAKGPAL